MIFVKLFDFLYLFLYGYEKYYKRKGAKIGKECSIRTKYFSSEPYLIEIGNHVQITDGVRFFTDGYLDYNILISILLVKFVLKIMCI